MVRCPWVGVLTWHGADVGAAVPPDLRLVPHATQADALERAAQHLCRAQAETAAQQEGRRRSGERRSQAESGAS